MDTVFHVSKFNMVLKEERCGWGALCGVHLDCVQSLLLLCMSFTWGHVGLRVERKATRAVPIRDTARTGDSCLLRLTPDADCRTYSKM